MLYSEEKEKLNRYNQKNREFLRELDKLNQLTSVSNGLLDRTKPDWPMVEKNWQARKDQLEKVRALFLELEQAFNDIHGKPHQN